MELIFFFSFRVVSPHLRAVGLDSHLTFRSWCSEAPPRKDGLGGGGQEGEVWVGL